MGGGILRGKRWVVKVRGGGANDLESRGQSKDLFGSRRQVYTFFNLLNYNA